MVGIAEEDRTNHGWTTSRNGQASQTCHCYASQMTEADGQSLKWRRKSPNDGWAPHILVSYIEFQLCQIRDFAK